MPKIKKIRAAALTGRSIRHEPLGQTMQEDQHKNQYASSGRRRRPRDRQRQIKEDGDDDGLLDEKTSQRILKLSKEQQDEIQAEEQRQHYHQKKKQHQLQHRGAENDSDDEDDDHNDDEVDGIEDDDELLVQEQDGGYVTMAEGAPGLSPEEEALVASMMQSTGERKTLADLILEKIGQQEAAGHGEDHDHDDQHDHDQMGGLPPKVVAVYTDIGKILSRYTSGKLPKAFKVIPSLSNWEQVLYLTRPDQWTPQAMFAATRIFASNLNPKMAQRFYQLVLLDGVRSDIQGNKKLNYHYYMALKKSVYKPAAFFKGILLPLCRDNCTLREAAIVASVLQRVTIPVLHSAVAIHKLAQLREYNGAASIFIKTLLNKKYSLPAPVIGSLVQHFASFQRDARTLPVLWHQALLTFVQRYKNEVRDEARESLRLVMKKHYHAKITPEIRRELFGTQAWKEERTATTAGTGAAPVTMDSDSIMA